MLQRFLFAQVKKKIPKISDTELIALNCGDTSVDRAILMGKSNVKDYVKHSYGFYRDNYVFSSDKVTHLLKDYETKPFDEKLYPNANNNYWIQRLAKEKFFSFLIHGKYGGNKLSVNEMSDILTKISSLDPALGVVTMVPNSLGPGELLTHYGTETQKETYLPKLADGTYIPCFGLTGPTNGSDATGNIDTGKVVLKQYGSSTYKVIQITINKRYITLAPVANLIGLAFNLEDPDKLLSEGKPGITVALVESTLPGIKLETHHNPMNVGFPNGTIKGTFEIPIENIIGGEKKAGHGWKMLMECLGAGRGISLPATANASSKVATFGILKYIQTRWQFKMPIANMEAIQEKVNNMVFHTWLIQSSVALTNDILDQGTTPSVISAIMKQQCTERGRLVLNDALDIQGGSGICLGDNNFLEKFYRGAPIGITVEGSNTLTRSLIIFGQGLNKSHPHIFPILQSVINNDINSFMRHFQNIVLHTGGLYFKTLSLSNSLEQQIINFATLSNFVALKGGKLKKEQMCSGDMATIFGNLYMALASRYYSKLYIPNHSMLPSYIENRIINENNEIINRVIDNLGPEKYILCHLKRKVVSKNYEVERKFFKTIKDDPVILYEIQKNIYMNNILKTLNETNIPNDEKVISVGEYSNNKQILQM